MLSSHGHSHKKMESRELSPAVTYLCAAIQTLEGNTQDVWGTLQENIYPDLVPCRLDVVGPGFCLFFIYF